MQNRTPRFTGFFTGEQPIITHLPMITILIINEILKPPVYLYNAIKRKIDGFNEPKFDEPELNEWYPYYKETGKYPEFLLNKYPNLPDLFSGKVKTGNMDTTSASSSSEKINADSTQVITQTISQNDTTIITDTSKPSFVETDNDNATTTKEENTNQDHIASINQSASFFNGNSTNTNSNNLLNTDNNEPSLRNSQ